MDLTPIPPADDDNTEAGPYIELSRAAFADLAERTDIDIDEEALERIRGLGDPTSQRDVVEIYRPLTQLIHLYCMHTGALFEASDAFLRLGDHGMRRTPFVIGIAGSVAVGKSTVARLLKELLARSPRRPEVELITTDGFLYPNSVLEEKGLLERKGFPESYDRKALLQFVVDVKSGVPEVAAPVYSHISYDIVPDEKVVVRHPDILIVEGLNVLQPPRLRSNNTTGLTLSDFFDFSVYVDAREDDIIDWYLSRFLALRRTAFTDPDSYFTEYAALPDDQAVAVAREIWDQINGPNLRHNVLPTRGRATAILHKGHDHEIESIWIRKI
ncbi:MAG: type I pantothenate kinase [Acidipropionibacterium acidipropionici]|jgi:type I pantothenate kinase|uniref:Pantothenate kinase n=2 Tax=Acidipropionibacterium acidipropionici TaxID=1748 RepID=A0A142KFZ6_9ACTN|nr:type I pantothenate kinase [Acidipropionibacterium acidipropionici]AFV90288.1 Pantothenate kinase [Acidipropionibacterium acidipropionici ATCC 4875]ALN15461.1 type I pantothenate kinase [Acidipropionibacterium acidipropionici]AMS05034.1 pantothenate kinase [Acidipropionibacterium acidipropionici]AOZ46514.1 type I pantothenate kinase [Acidipropionibacterium acidipropionici]APZ08791.1 type I pantothenate kinase [Acidipropionibacterium acidipropionici]